MHQNILRLASCCLLTFSLFTTSCSSDKNGDRVLFGIDNDVKLGAQVSQEVDSTYRANGQLLDRNSANPGVQRAYVHLDKMVARLLASGAVSYKDEFAWDVKIINDPENLNAFATPGGHIYVFTGLIKYLDTEDQLAGVLGHEIAHADQRHTVKQLQKQYGINFLLSLVLNESSGEMQQIAGQLAGRLAGLKFSRDYERESDDYSVKYLAATKYYACDGAAGFFQKMQSLAQSGNIPEFISTHPNPDNRIAEIQARAKEAGCSTTPQAKANYNQFKRDLGLL
jgi:predicted Zn-dependent protease